MVEGVEVKVPSFFWPVTCFVMFLAAMNPLVKLNCLKNCKENYVSEFDGEAYIKWRGDTWLQADGNLTMFKLTHGYVHCENSCNDCDEENCKFWNYEEMKKLDRAIKNRTNYNSSLPEFLTTMCYCADFCEDKCKNGFIALPGNDSMDANWEDMDCKKLEADHNATDSGKICGLVDLYRRAHILTIACLVMMIILQITMLGLEYVNFDSFLDGRCKCLFCPYWIKKTLYIFLACVCLGVQLYTFLPVKEKTDEKLDAYFDVINAEFEYDWHTRGYYLFIAAIVGSCVTIFTMVFLMPRVERQKKKSYRNDIHGISTESVLARKF